MARVKIALPKQFIFETEMQIRISDINYGNHLANDAVLHIAQEARIRFLKQFGYSEKSIEGVGLIMSDAAIIYKSQAFHGDVLAVSLAIEDIGELGFDFVYTFKNKGNEKEVARVKTGIVFFDYTTNRLSKIPEKFLNKINYMNPEK